MKKNETNWRKWYLVTVGKQWREEDGSALDGLTAEQQSVGQLLYRRYLQEKKSEQDAQYDRLQQDLATKEQLETINRNKRRLDQSAEETALSYGRQGTTDAERLRQDLERAYSVGYQGVQDDAKERSRTLARRYLQSAAKADEALDRDLAATEKEYAARYQSAWDDLKQSLSARLPEYKSEYDASSYSEEGVGALRQEVESRKDALGNKYQEALDWLDELPVYRNDGSKMLLRLPQGAPIVIDKADYDLADVVTDVKGMGSKLSTADVLTITYAGTKYYARPTEKVGADQNALFTAIANKKMLSMTVGCVLYNKGALYVCDGKGQWYATQNAGAVGYSNLQRLLGQIDRLRS